MPSSNGLKVELEFYKLISHLNNVQHLWLWKWGFIELVKDVLDQWWSKIICSWRENTKIVDIKTRSVLYDIELVSFLGGRWWLLWKTLRSNICLKNMSSQFLKQTRKIIMNMNLNSIRKEQSYFICIPSMNQRSNVDQVEKVLLSEVRSHLI